MRAAQRITVHLVQEWIEQFLEKNQDYNSEPMPGFPSGFENADVLGIPGQFAELWRKIWKLKKGMWDGQELTGEQPREILFDFIGHCFLAIDMIDRAAEAANPTPTQHVFIHREGSVSSVLNTESIPYAPPKPSDRCGPVCLQGHTYTGECKLRRNAGRKNA